MEIITNDYFKINKGGPFVGNHNIMHQLGTCLCSDEETKNKRKPKYIFHRTNHQQFCNTKANKFSFCLTK